MFQFCVPALAEAGNAYDPISCPLPNRNTVAGLVLKVNVPEMALVPSITELVLITGADADAELPTQTGVVVA